jgi:hypothetical protein
MKKRLNTILSECIQYGDNVIIPHNYNWRVAHFERLGIGEHIIAQRCFKMGKLIKYGEQIL